MTDELEHLKGRLVIGRKRDGRSVYKGRAGGAVHAARHLRVAPNARVRRQREPAERMGAVVRAQESGWVRRYERKNARPAQAQLVQIPAPAFVPVTIEAATTTAPAGPALDLQARLPNGVVVDLRGCDCEQVGRLVEALGRLRCSVSTKP